VQNILMGHLGGFGPGRPGNVVKAGREKLGATLSPEPIPRQKMIISGPDRRKLVLTQEIGTNRYKAHGPVPRLEIRRVKAIWCSIWNHPRHVEGGGGPTTCLFKGCTIVVAGGGVGGVQKGIPSRARQRSQLSIGPTGGQKRVPPIKKWGLGARFLRG